ncbi:flagellar export protein FliJ [Nitrosococcus oceani]|uniref:flagellar export protein FliJ n=1 Tax=Nitrosococcus oceani TaxID=1229 RepID=UPI0004E973E2|nr:flagellar export protein FliJ [Nitrosococcus oceani]KFI21983.1 flagellar biosynthesis protein FliJ [Nitrosococcus oceani]
MTRSRRLYSLLRVAATQEQQAAKVLGETQHLFQQQQRQLGEMSDYREEYAQRCQSVGQKGISAQQLQQLQSFLARLDQAIYQQKQQVERSSQLLEQKRKGWFAVRSQVKALEKLQDRYQREERNLAAYHEQAEMDDRNQHNFRVEGTDNF